MQDAVNWAIVLAFDALLLHAAGWRALLYLLAASTLGAGLHPLAGHLLAEHVVFVPGQETYSYVGVAAHCCHELLSHTVAKTDMALLGCRHRYYGRANGWMYNVGYHNEHHDFPQIPGSRLPRLRAIAPEFYDSLAYHTSYTWVLWKFITEASLGPWRRVRRAQREGAGALHPAVGARGVVAGPVQQCVKF